MIRNFVLQIHLQNYQQKIINLTLLLFLNFILLNLHNLLMLYLLFYQDLLIFVMTYTYNILILIIQILHTDKEYEHNILIYDHQKI